MIRRRQPPNPADMAGLNNLPSAKQQGPRVSSGDSGVSGPRNTSSINNGKTEAGPALPFLGLCPTTKSLPNSQLHTSDQLNSNLQTHLQAQYKKLIMQTPITISNSLPFKTAFGPKVKISISCPEGPYGRTKQSFKADADINTIVDRFLRTGVLDYAAKHEGRYGDATGPDFQTAQNFIAAANSMFAELPAKLRNRFKNDPAEFFDFVHDPRNVEEAITLGLMKRRPEAEAPSHLEDGSATHEPLRAPDGTFREHTRQEKRDEARQQKAADAAKPITST